MKYISSTRGKAWISWWILSFSLLAQLTASWTLHGVISMSPTINKNVDRRDRISLCVQAHDNDGTSMSNDDVFHSSRRRDVIHQVATTLGASAAGGFFMFGGNVQTAMAIPTIDVNNAMAREFTAFPGLYPTIATKIVNAAKSQPFTSKKQIYEILSEAESERLKQYDKSLIISKPDRQLQQFKNSQICKYECGSRTSNSFRDEQIKAVQAGRMGLE